MKNAILIFILILLLSCSGNKREKPTDYSQLYDKIEKLKQKYHLVDVRFDTEYIYNPGDLSNLLSHIVNTTIPEKRIKVNEQLSKNGKFYVATVTNSDTTIQISTPINSDWLSDDVMDKVFKIPEIFKSNKKFYLINPVITGQDAWFFCGLEEDLKAAKKEGLPIYFSGEDPTTTPEFTKFQ
ncbi:hypothetical protein HUW51_18880 [Adhaeribacter swui]|uniref:Uncharacterized protein n=1 Tax=Adhaeribacter swui TaxID=2086471 RepID=A0A7G7GC06_9BACT|nr:hypothetical protein [Adhaeribacter swui]QNF34690.1 hypothetical protein HUW51_18880 [Adhaeribacter swui]